VALIRRVCFYVWSRWYVFRSFWSINKQLFVKNYYWKWNIVFYYDSESIRQSLQRKQPTSLQPNEIRMPKSQMKTVLITFFDIKGIIHFELIIQGQTATEHILWEYWSGYMKLWVRKGLKFVPGIGFSTMTVLQLTRRSLSSSCGPKVDYWNGTLTLFPWFGSECLLAVPKIKFCLKATKISGYWRHPKKVTRALKTVPQQEFQKRFQQWQRLWAKCISDQGVYFEGDPTQ
jgi:hypothetical protein